jgi:hypothetical protein
MAATTLRRKHVLLLEACDIMCEEVTDSLQVLISMFEERRDVAICKQLKELFWTFQFINSEIIGDVISRVVETLITCSSRLTKEDAEHLNIVLESARKIAATFIEIRNVEEQHSRLKSLHDDTI